MQFIDIHFRVDLEHAILREIYWMELILVTYVKNSTI